MVSQGTRTQQKTVFWPLIIHPLIIHPLWCAGRCWFTGAGNGPLCCLDDSLLLKFTRMSIQNSMGNSITKYPPQSSTIHLQSYLSINDWSVSNVSHKKNHCRWHNPCCAGFCFWAYQQVLESNLSFNFHTRLNPKP
jgi:hypothetical protein